LKEKRAKSFTGKKKEKILALTLMSSSQALHTAVHIPLDQTRSGVSFFLFF
jgi:hypothetical protein